jgi:hypothetical protein
MRIEQKQIEVTDALISLMNKAEESWGFMCSAVALPTTESEYLACVHFDGGELKATWTQVQAEIALLQAESQAKQYQYDRLNEYPSLADQLDKIFHDGVDAWKAEIQAIKNKYPKPE